MYCTNCGAKLDEDSKVCNNCKEVVNNKPRKKNSKAIIILVIVIILISCVALGGYRLYLWGAEMKAQELERQRQVTIEKTLSRLGGYGRKYGSEDINTANYSMALSFLAGALIEDYNPYTIPSEYNGRKKEYYFEQLTMYFDRSKYLQGFAVLLYGYDYLNKEDIEFFSTGEKVSEEQLKEEFIKALVEYNIGINSFLINKKDKEIINNISLKLRLAKDGYVSVEQMYIDLYSFVFEDMPLKEVKTSLLEKEIEYEEIAGNVNQSFNGQDCYFDELTTTGKLVFLYMIPRFLSECSDEGLMLGSNLWFPYYQDMFDKIWKEITSDGLFADVIG